MFKSKVIDIFRTFSSEEIKNYRYYIQSPIHNSNKKVVKLYEYIKKHYPDFRSPSLRKESLFKKLYPGKKYSDIVMRILISDMLRLAEEFLAYQRFCSEPLAEKRYLLEELKIRKIETLFNRHIREAAELMEREGSINNSYFLHRFDLESAKVNFLIATDKQGKSSQALAKMGEYLADFFLVNGLNLMQQLEEHNEVLNAKYDFSLLDIFFKNLNVENIVNELKSRNYKYYPVIEIYYNIYKFCKNYKSVEQYLILKRSIMQNLSLFDQDERFNLLLSLESCSITRIRMGVKNCHEDIMSVYELMLSQHFFSKDKYIQVNLFRNIFYTAVILKRYKWAENFSKEYFEYLLPEQRHDTYNYMQALLFFERKKYQDALESISKVNYSFFIFKYDAKILMLKIYYEINFFEPALALIDSFSHFLDKNKGVSEPLKQQFKTFLKFLKMLIKNKLSEGQQRNNYEELVVKTENSSHFIGKKWIMEKIYLLKS